MPPAEQREHEPADDGAEDAEPIVMRMPMLSLPGTRARAMKPTMSPKRIEPRIVKMIM